MNGCIPWVFEAAQLKRRTKRMLRRGALNVAKTKKFLLAKYAVLFETEPRGDEKSREERILCWTS